jgi:methanogenic corrinoid protein MtbC1
MRTAPGIEPGDCSSRRFATARRNDGISLVSRDSRDGFGFEPELMKCFRKTATETSDFLGARLIFRELVNDAATHAPGAIYVDCIWDENGRAHLTVEDLGPGKVRRVPALLARMPANLRVRAATLLGTATEVILPLERRADEAWDASLPPAPPYKIFRRMEIGSWIVRHAGVLGGEARGDLTAERVPLPPHDAAGPGRSEVQMAVEIGLAIYYNTVPLWLRDARWLTRSSAARGIPAQRLNEEWQAVFRVIGMRLPVPDTGILTRMRDAVSEGFTFAGEERDVAEGSPAADFLASFGTHEGPLAEYERLRARGSSDEEIFAEVLTPAQIETGRQWQLGRLSVAEEHRRTSVVRELIGRTPDTPGGTADGFCVVAGCAPHERHTVGLEMATTLLRARGVRVECLSPDASPEEILLGVIVHDARAVLLSATLSAGIYELIGLVDLLRQDARTAGVAVVLGGAPFNEFPGLCAVVGGDAVLADAREALRFCEDLRARDVSRAAPLRVAAIK